MLIKLKSLINVHSLLKLNRYHYYRMMYTIIGDDSMARLLLDKVKLCDIGIDADRFIKNNFYEIYLHTHNNHANSYAYYDHGLSFKSDTALPTTFKNAVLNTTIGVLKNGRDSDFVENIILAPTCTDVVDLHDQQFLIIVQ